MYFAMTHYRARHSFVCVFLASFFATYGMALSDRHDSLRTFVSSGAELGSRGAPLPDKVTVEFFASDVSGGGVVDLSWSSEPSSAAVTAALDGSTSLTDVATTTETVTAAATDVQGTEAEPVSPTATSTSDWSLHTRTVTVTVTTRVADNSSISVVAATTRSLSESGMTTGEITTVVGTNTSTSDIGRFSANWPTIPLLTGSQTPLASNTCSLAMLTASLAGTGTDLSRGWAAGACSSWWTSGNGTNLSTGRWTPVNRTYITYVWSTPTAASIATFMKSSAPRTVPNNLVLPIYLFRNLAPMLALCLAALVLR